MRHAAIFTLIITDLKLLCSEKVVDVFGTFLFLL